MEKRGDLEAEETIYRRLKPMKGSKGMQLVTKGPPPRSGKRVRPAVYLCAHVVRLRICHFTFLVIIFQM